MKISVCMIVKNEEAVLARCLDSLQGIYDELIIVDTGSVDQTKKIAANYQAKLFDYTWKNDFADARNFSFSKATMDYIYVADADEVLEQEEKQKFLKLKQALIPEVEIVQMYYKNQLKYNTSYNFDMELRPKLYKRVREFVWIDPIHEQVRLQPIVFDSDIVISHEPMSCHASRDFGIYHDLIQKGVELSKRLQDMFARELFISGTEKDFIHAEPYFKRLLDTTSDIDQLQMIYSVLVHSALCKRSDELYTYSMKVLAANIATSEICFDIGEFYFNKRDYREASIWYYNACYECNSILNIHYEGDYALTRLADCYHELNLYHEEEQYRVKAKEWSSKP